MKRGKKAGKKQELSRHTEDGLEQLQSQNVGDGRILLDCHPMDL